MVEIDLRNNGNFGHQNIRGVQAASHSNFANGKLRARAREKFKCQSRDALEKCGMSG